MNDTSISGLMESTLQNLKGMTDVNSIIGDPIVTPDGTTILPVSKVSVAFGTGGSDLPPGTAAKSSFGGGGGGGVTVQPVAFLVVKDGNVKLLQINKNQSTTDRVVDLVPEVIDKVSGFMNKDKKEAAPITPPTE